MFRHFQPRRVRPDMPNYGVHAGEAAGILPWDWVESRLQNARSYWLCTTRPDSRPHAVPIWCVGIDGDLIFGCDPVSRKALNVAERNEIVMHLESGDEVVIIEGSLDKLNPDAALQATINSAFADKYNMPYGEDEDILQFRVIPRKIMAWDESSFPASVTFFYFN